MTVHRLSCYMNIPEYSKLFIQIVRERSCTGNVRYPSSIMPSLEHMLNSSSRTKASHSHYLSMSCPNILFVAELTSLESRRDQLSRSCFQDVCQPSSSFCHLLPPPRDTSVLSQLRTAARVHVNKYLYVYM